MTWKTIDSAPKDKTKVLLWNGRWHEMAWWEAHSGNGEGFTSWRVANNPGREVLAIHEHDAPTHWQPLPDPPG